jgi:FkbM family methyltransferase
MLSEDQIRLAYRLFLRREPRSYEVAARRATVRSLRGLMDELLASGERDGATAEFRPYVLRDGRVGEHSFDFLIADPESRQRYDGIVRGHSPEIDWCLSRIQEGMTVLDCGAHHGLMSVCFAKATGPRGRVLAWDARPPAAAVAEWNLAMNGCANSTVRASALGEKRASVSCDADPDALRRSADLSALPEAPVETVTLDAELEDEPRVDFIKLDVGGSEVEVLRGAPRTLARRPILALKLHNLLVADRFRAMCEILYMLAPLGYRYWLQPIRGGAVSEVIQNFYLAEVPLWDDPHLFCEPR